MQEIGRSSAKVTFVFEPGSDFFRTFKVRIRENETATPEDADLTGSTFTLEIRRVANESVLHSIACSASGSDLTISVPAATINGLAAGPTEAEVASRYHGRLLWLDSVGRKRRPITILILVSHGIPS